MNLLHRLHLLPNGESMPEQRVEEAAAKVHKDGERDWLLSIGEELTQKVRRGDEDAPSTVDDFMDEVEKRRQARIRRRTDAAMGSRKVDADE